MNTNTRHKTGLIPLMIAIAIAGVLVFFVLAPYVAAWDAPIDARSITVGSPGALVPVSSESIHFIWHAGFSATGDGTLSCGEEQVSRCIGGTSTSPKTCDRELRYACTGYTLKLQGAEEVQVIYTTELPNTPELGEINLDTGAVEEALSAIGISAFIFIFLVSLWLSRLIFRQRP
jgi:hypothetical protein